MSRLAAPIICAGSVLLALLAAPLSFSAQAALASEGEGNATWRLEQPPPPEAEVRGATPVALGHIGDIEFLAPNRGLLITAGNGTPAISAGVWAYDGAGWKEIANVCGATDGRIAWAGEDEFWTVSDGRPGEGVEQEGAVGNTNLEDDTLCHFAGGRVVTSYASLAGRPSSYVAMHAAACLATNDCWFAGNALPNTAAVTGSFHLHWNGSSLVEEPFEGEAQPVEDMRGFEGRPGFARLYESVEVTEAGRTLLEPPVLHLISPAGVSPTFETLTGEATAPEELESSSEIPIRGPGVFPDALRALDLSANEHELWGATGPVAKNSLPPESEPGQVTVVRYADGEWRQLVGPSTNPTGQTSFPDELVTSIAAEPGGGGAWLALASQHEVESGVASPEAHATVVHVSPQGAISEEQSLPSTAEQESGVGEKGRAARITCPAAHDCWLATTEGWLFHLTSGHEGLAVDDEGFSNLITNRPQDEGLPQVPPDAPPEESSGPAELQSSVTFVEKSTPLTESRATLPLLTHLHSRLVHGSTLELRFHLAVKAHVQLVAKRHLSTVASTPMRTLAAGDRAVLLRLDPHRWPTKLELKTHALAPLPTVAARSPTVNTISTSLAFPNGLDSSTAGSLF